MSKWLLTLGIISLFILSAFAPILNADIVDINSNIEKSSTKITVYIFEVGLEFGKESWGSFSRKWWGHGGGGPYRIHIDANLDELIMEFVMNYTAEMNYNLGRPYPLAPIVAFGLKVENYTDYIWETFKLEHNGYAKQDGNISVEINIDMSQYESGDIEYLQSSFVLIGEQSLQSFHLKTPNNESSYAFLLRILYNMPILGKLLLHNWLLPILAPYNQLILPTWLYFD